MNTREQKKEGMVENMDSFKRDKSIVKTFIEEIVLDSLIETTKDFKKFQEENIAEKIIKIKEK